MAEVERKHILAFQYELRDKPTVANRAIEMLVKMFNLAEVWELRPSNSNPCRFVRRYKVQPQHERFLTPEELQQLGQALDAAPGERLASKHGATAIRLLVLTGCRRNEIMGLRWDDVNFQAGELRLRDSKADARVVPLTPPAAELLADLPRVAGNPWVFPGRKRGTHQRNINDSWDRIRRRAGLDGVRLHDLAPLVRLARPGIGGEPFDDWQAARSHPGADDRALCPPRTGLGESIGGQSRREPQSGYGDEW